MDFYEDNHVIATPQQVMVVQLRDGEKPPFRRAGTVPPRPGRTGHPADKAPKAEVKAGPEPFRIDVQGLMKRTYPPARPPGNYFYLKAGKGKVLWASVDQFTEDEYEEIFRPNGARPNGPSTSSTWPTGAKSS